MGILSNAFQKKRAFALLCLVFASLSAQAQPHIGLYGMGTFPQGIFHNNGYRNGYGGGLYYISGNLFHAGKYLPQLRLGGNMDIEGCGSRKFKGVQLDSPQKGTATVFFSNSSMAFSGFLRLSVPTGKVSPYADMMAGVRCFFTSQTIKQDHPRDNPGYEESTGNQIMNTSCLTLGAAAGLTCAVSDQLLLDLGLGYHYGNTASYLSLKDVRRDDNEFRYSVQKGPFSQLFLRFGLMVKLESGSYASSQPENNNYTPSPAPVPSQSPNRLQSNKPGI